MNVSPTGNAEIEAQATEQASDAPVSTERDRSVRSDRASSSQSVIGDQSDETTDEGNAATSLNIPESVAKDLGSSDARDRHRALEYWETQTDPASLIPVFEAMEDEDPGVRAKAAAIVEQHLDVEKEQEGG